MFVVDCFCFLFCFFFCFDSVLFICSRRGAATFQSESGPGACPGMDWHRAVLWLNRKSLSKKLLPHFKLQCSVTQASSLPAPRI